MNALSRNREKRESLKHSLAQLYVCISSALLTADDLWGIDQETSDKFVMAYSEVLNAYGEDGNLELLRKELEDRNIAIRLGEDFFTKPSGKRKYDLVEKLPCRIGNEVWAIRSYNGHERACRGVVSEMFFTEQMQLVIVVHHLTRGTWGEKIFATKEEAEKAIKKRKESKLHQK